jgi:hypothetical protein
VERERKKKKKPGNETTSPFVPLLMTTRTGNQITHCYCALSLPIPLVPLKLQFTSYPLSGLEPHFYFLKMESQCGGLGMDGDFGGERFENRENYLTIWSFSGKREIDFTKGICQILENLRGITVKS